MSHYVTHQDLKESEARIMSALADLTAKLTASIEAAETRVNAELATLRDQIPTQTELDAIAAAVTKSDGLAAPVVVPAGTGN